MDITEEEKQLYHNDALISGLHSVLHDGQRGLSEAPEFIRSVIEQDAWKIRIVEVTGHPASFDSFTAFVKASPPEGLGTDVAMLKRLCKDEPEVLKMLREATTGKPGERTDLVDNINEVKGAKRSDGTAKDYTLDRLARGHPNLYAAVVD